MVRRRRIAQDMQQPSIEYDIGRTGKLERTELKDPAISST
jgi:hypothetical protein